MEIYDEKGTVMNIDGPTAIYSFSYQYSVVVTAFMIAKEAHEGQFYDDDPYFERHVLAVTNRVEQAENFDWKLTTVALLHDVLEDTHTTRWDLIEAGFSEEIVDAVESVTRDKSKETYMEFIDRCALNPLGRKVKYHDLCENMSNDGKPELEERYRRALSKIKGAIKEGSLS